MKLKLMGNRLKTKFHFTKWGMVALAVVLAFGSIGVSYASFGKGWGRGGNPFKWTSIASTTNTLGVQFSNQKSNDPPGPASNDPNQVGSWTVPDRDSPGGWTWAGAVPDRYDKDVASIDCALTTVTDPNDPDIDTNDTMTVTISNGYPCYYGNVAFTIDNKENFPVKVKSITLVGVMGTTVSQSMVACTTYYVDADTSPPTVDTTLDFGDDFSIHLSTIAVGQELQPAGSAGDTLFGDIAVHVEQAARENDDPNYPVGGYTFRIKINFEAVSIRKSGTAYAYGYSYATCFYSIDRKYPWGWTNGPLPAGHYEFPMYVGASDCQPSPAKLVGWVIIDYSGSTLTATFNMNEGYMMDATHLYVGNEILPRGPNGKFTHSPGQYPYQHTNLGGAETDSYPPPPITGLSGAIYIIAHADVFWYE